MAAFVFLYLFLVPVSMNLVDQSRDVTVICRTAVEDEHHHFYAEIILQADAPASEYRLQVSTWGPNGRSRQSQSGAMKASERMPVRAGSIRVKLTEDSSYECICTVVSDGVVLASDTLRKL